ncbi:MAG: sortase [Candidatus Gottesmanbacteria bacterium]|nr:sortase [Candidatus Gottesmanbacteria bacterium]
MAYQFIKAPPTITAESHRASTVVPKARVPRQRSGISYLFMLGGFIILSWALWPIVSFMLITAPQFTSVVSPVQDGYSTIGVTNLLSPVAKAASDQDIVKNGPDYTNANVWFPTSPQKKIVSNVTAYTLSIPKLKIADALVRISGDDLSKSLIHYGGTGLPGEYGTSVIFGHSVLPQFYNPTNYKTIFSTLPTLKPGDEIFVRFDDVEYRYVVYEMIVTEANDLAPLAQRFDDSYVTLITCVPPGTYWKRLNVRARLEKI